MTPTQRKVLDDAVVWFEKDNEQYTADKTKETLDMQAKAGIKSVNFGSEFKKVAVDVYWDDLKHLSPANIDKLKGMLTK